MPIHDWTRVDAGIFHVQHMAWITQMLGVLNSGLLLAGYYALVEQVAGAIGPDVVTTHPQPKAPNGTAKPNPGGISKSNVTVQTRTRPRTIMQSDNPNYASRQRSMSIRHVSDHRIVAIIEVVSHSNKASDYAMQTFLNKVLGCLCQGIHLLILDLQPPTTRDPHGIHGAIWQTLTGQEYLAPAEAPLTLVAYEAGPTITAHVEAVAVGELLPTMPLFLDEECVEVPLEETYLQAYRMLPGYYREILERPNAEEAP